MDEPATVFPEAPAVEPVTQRAFDDVNTTRQAIFDNVMGAFQKKYPLSNDRYTLKLNGLKYRAPKQFTTAEQKRAIMRGRTLGWNLTGAWELLNNKTGEAVDRTKQQLVAQVPYMTNRGTFIYNGSEYTVAGQMRLRPGVYSRVKENGLIEAHFNVKGGSGPSFRVYMEPDTGIFRMNVGQANLKLYPILKSMGFSDRQLLSTWGKDLLHANVAASDPRAVQRAVAKLVKPSGAPPEMRKAAQEQNRVRAKFVGKLVCDDSKPGKPWAYLKIHKGLPEAAYEALTDQGIECESRFDMPHISVLREWEAQALVKKYGRGWKKACGDGRIFPFSLQNAMVDLAPEGWKNMDRVWFLEAKSPELRAHRKSMQLDELPHGDESDDEFQFHITVAVRKKAKPPRGRSKLDGLFDGTEDKTKVAFERLLSMVKEARQQQPRQQQKKAQINLPFGLESRGEPEQVIDGPEDPTEFDPADYDALDIVSKLAAALDVSDPVDEAGEISTDLYEIQEQAAQDIKGSPAALAAKLRQRRALQESQDVAEADQATKATITGKGLLRKQLLTGATPKTAPVEPPAKLAYMALVGRNGMVKRADSDYGPQLRGVFDKMELDPATTEHTLGRRVNNVSPDLIVDVTKKLISINKKEAETDDRDALAFQRVMGPEDFFAERVSRDAGGLGRRLLWRATFKGGVGKVAPGALSPQLRSVLLKSGLASPLEEVNPLEVLDQLVRVTRMGEGGMPSDDAVPDEARGVQPSHFGVVDPVRAPEGMRIGVDSRVAHRTYKGSDGNLYADMLNAKTGKPQRVSVQRLAKSVVAFPGELTKKGDQLRAMINGKRLAYVKREEIDYELPHTSHMFTATSNMVPMVSSIKGGRLLMGAKMATQALPLQDAETPLVQNLSDDQKRSFEELYGEKVGAVRARGPGAVEEVTKNHIKVRYADGQTEKHELYHTFPFNRKTYIHNSPAVKVGDPVKKNTLLAKSNYTDNEGNVALGKNLRVAYMAYRGFNADDAIVISEKAAKALSSEHMYTTRFKIADNQEVGKRAFLSLYPGRFNKKQMATIDNTGVVKPGTTVQFGDPLVLAVDKRKPTGRGVLRGRKQLYRDVADTWGHEVPGVVTDVDRMKGGWKVLTRAYSPMNVGDKLSGRYGNKGVVSRIIPDDQMPHDKDGGAMDILLNPLGVVSRVNPAQLIETALGKVAKKTGKPFKMPGFMDESYVDFAKRELQRAGLSDTEDLYDPQSGRKIPKVFTGHTYMMKLHHMAEPKASGRDVGAYTSEGIPARGGQEGSKRIGSGEMNALVSHGATNVIRDAKVVRGQRNDDYWRALRLGYPPPSPKVPVVYEKFLAHLQGAGINLKKKGDVLHLFAATDNDVADMSSGPLTRAKTVTGDKMDPVEGGLFDVGKTGGHGGGRWSHIQLATHMPNPVMEEPIRRILGLTKKQFEGTIDGTHKLETGTGTRAIYDALERVNVDSAIARAQEAFREGPASKRDTAIKLLGYLQTLKKSGTKPSALMVRKVPVLPPNFRPITATNKLKMEADANALYVELMNANKAYQELQGDLGEAHTGDERLQVYKAFKAVTGLGDPISAKSQQKGVRGLLKHVFGGSPKGGMFQRRVLGAAVDTVGRGVITPNPSLNMDQVGLPEGKAWILYRPFVMRHLVRRGMGAMAAARAIESKGDVARKALLDEMTKRPVIINRAPVLHRYGMMAAWPTLTKGNTLQIPPIVTPGFNADFDGDAMNFHVPVSDDAVQDAVNKMMPSRNLRSVADFDVHYYPRQEFLHGLHIASTSKKRGVKTFVSEAAVIAAYKRGELGVDDQVQISRPKSAGG